MKVKIIGMGALGVMYANYIKRESRRDAGRFVMEGAPGLKGMKARCFYAIKRSRRFVWRTARRRKRRIL